MRIERIVYNDDMSDMMYLYKLNDREIDMTGNKTKYVVTDHEIKTVEDYERACYYLRNNNKLRIDDDTIEFACICMKMQLEINDLTTRISHLQDQVTQISNPERNLYKIFVRLADEEPEVLSKYTGIPNDVIPYDIS